MFKMTPDYINHRKAIMVKNRKAINIFDWVNYLEENYLTWWESLYKNKWPVIIIYYPDSTTSEVLRYYMMIDKNTNMLTIMNSFKLFLEKQQMAINLCFNNDISPIINQYMPRNTIDTFNNYFYVHKEVIVKKKAVSGDYYNIYPRNIREKVENCKTLLQLSCDLRNQSMPYITLRLKHTPLKYSKKTFGNYLHYV